MFEFLLLEDPSSPMMRRLCIDSLLLPKKMSSFLLQYAVIATGGSSLLTLGAIVFGTELCEPVDQSLCSQIEFQSYDFAKAFQYGGFTIFRTVTTPCSSIKK
mmetsp:Transcript_27238/g.66115  ORF Transcript_27238/g.66115 Transcript_27238/m.66115 type:complete len:102 (+) Transcript_27238:589-894(+)